jgi:hypothetical protein
LVIESRRNLLDTQLAEELAVRLGKERHAVFPVVLDHRANESTHSTRMLQHSLGVEEGTVHRDGVPHDLAIAISVAVEHLRAQFSLAAPGL